MKYLFASLCPLILIACERGDRPQDPVDEGVDAAAEQTSATAPAAGIYGEAVAYEFGGVALNGYLAYDPSQDGPRPGVLIVHEWWGHNDYVRERARKLAAMGYTAFALDMYGDGKVAMHPQDAQKFMGEVVGNMDVAKARFMAAKELLESHPTTDASKTAAIGYCFGGAVVLHMARAGVDLDGVASFHGDLSTQSPVQPGVVKARLFVANGEADPFVPAEQVAALKSEMQDAGVDLNYVGYPGVKHSFTNPGATALGAQFDLPLAYDAAADADSWARLEAFLEESLAP